MARKILLADDSVTAQNMGRKILADAGYDIITVNNGSAALKRIAEIKPDLIVLDVYMPGYSGLEVCQRIKDSAETAHIPVLLTVGKLEPFKADEARRVKADAHIVKPFEASELLSAITKLEDRMVPQQADGGRFGMPSSGGKKAEGSDESDTGWKSRLRFPTKKKKEEVEPEPDAEEATMAASFRDFRKSKSKAAADGSSSTKTSAAQEPGAVPEIPRDITPEELDALSALAAKLDAPAAVAQAEAAPLEAPQIDSTKAPVAKIELEMKTEAEVPAVAAEANPETGPLEGQPAIAAVQAAVEIPVEQVEVAAMIAEAHPQTEAAMLTVSVNSSHLEQQPAPIDKNDEPMFATAASAVQAETPEAKTPEKTEEIEETEEKTETKAFQVVGQSAKVETTVTHVPAEAAAVMVTESKIEELKIEELKAEEAKLQSPRAPELPAERPEIEPPVAAITAHPAETEEPAPTDAELAEALRLLTPAPVGTDISTTPSHGTLVAAGQMLAEEAVRNASAAPRWMAESVALTLEEAAISLEAEMFGSFAATPTSFAPTEPATKPEAQPAVAAEAFSTSRVSSITAAVDIRLAQAELAASANFSTERSASLSSTHRPAQTTLAETVTPEVAENSQADAITAGKLTPESPAEKLAAEQKDSAVHVAEEPAAEELPAATFADAGHQQDAEPVSEPQPESVSVTADKAAPEAVAASAVATKDNQDSVSDAGGEDMGKDVKAKSGKWHQIRTAPAGAASTADALEAAKQAGQPPEEAPKAMAAAAAADGSSSSAAPDASTIASIVDSVMADLRPKIVEEIAKKLAGK